MSTTKTAHINHFNNNVNNNKYINNNIHYNNNNNNHIINNKDINSLNTIINKNGNQVPATKTREAYKRNEKGEYDYFRFDHNRIPFVVANEGRVADMEMLPMPPQDGFFYDIKTYEDVNKGLDPAHEHYEPRWNPTEHLRITDPEYLVRIDTWQKVKTMESVKSRNDGTSDSKLGFTSPFGLLTLKAVEIMRRIVNKQLDTKSECPSPRGNKRAVRGFWYSSPFIRDMMSCPQHLALLEEFTGEPLVPYFSYSNSPQINISKLGHKGTIDHWHVDGLKYVSVLMLSDMTQVEGGALEVMKCQKHEGLNKLEKGEDLDHLTYTVNYDRPGMCILNHGSEVLHHVTPITYNPNNIQRMSVIMAFGSRNAYRPNTMCLHTMTFCDSHSKLWAYEYYRYCAWQMMTVLKDMAENDKFEADNDKKLAQKLRLVADELTRVAHQIENPHADEMKYYHEDSKSTTTNHNLSTAKTNPLHQLQQQLPELKNLTQASKKCARRS